MERTARPLARIAALGALLTATIALPACEQVDPNSVEYQIQQLQEKKTKASIMKLGDMKAKEAVEPLMKAYEDGRFRADIISALAQIGDKAAAPTLIAAIGDKGEKEAARLAGTTLLEWDAGAGNSDAMIAVVGDKGMPNENRYSALQILARYPDAKATPVLLNVLKADPDVQPIAMAGLAAEALGKLKVEKAVRHLVRCLWLDDALGRNAVAECRLALARIGPKAVPTLIKTLERKNRTVEKRAIKYKFDKGGIVEAKAAEMLFDQPSAEAVDALIAAMTTLEEMPPSVAANPQKAQAFVMGGVQRVISTAKALASIGDTRAVKPMLEIAESKERPLEHKLAGVQQIAFLGSTDALKGLLDILDNDVNQYDPVSQGFRVQVALAIANLVPAGDSKSIKKLEKELGKIEKQTNEWIADNQKKIETTFKDKPKAKKQLEADIKGWNDQLKNFGEVTAKIAVIKACDDAIACYGKKAADEKVAVQLLAAYRLSNAKGDDVPAARDALIAAVDALLGKEKLTLDDPVVLNVLLFGLGRHGDAASAPRIAELQKKAKARGEKEKSKVFQGALKGSAYTLDLIAGASAHR